MTHVLVLKRLWWRGTPWWLALEWVPQDCWVGVYWTTKQGEWVLDQGRRSCHWEQEVHVYLCLFPCLPLHLKIPLKTPDVSAGPQPSKRPCGG
jgi:hypothetical protein